jgi:hypothetical protein
LKLLVVVLFPRDDVPVGEIQRVEVVNEYGFILACGISGVNEESKTRSKTQNKGRYE